MRRFLIWSGLAALIGLILAVGGVWAYNHFYVRFQPVTIDRNQAEIQRLLDSASWVSAGGGDQPVYVVGYRESAPTLAWLDEEAAKLHAAGGDIRILMFARPDREGEPLSSPMERATIAELWLTRDWSLYQRWMAQPARDWKAEGVTPADGDLARSAVVEASRQFARRLTDLLKEAGLRSDWPMVIWRDREGFLKACACSDRRSWASVRDDLGAPETIGADGAADAPPASDDASGPAEPAGPASPDRALPYPDLLAIPPATAPALPQNPVQPRPAAPRTANPAPPSRLEHQTTRPPAPRPSTQRPTEEEDTRFY